jgi:Domain of unknown function DUF29
MTATAKLGASPAAADRSLYERDFYSWAMQQAALLRERRLAELDVENVAEEIEDLGKEQAKALRSSYRLLLVHLLKWQHQRRRRSRSWAGTIVRERQNAALGIEDNSGLKSQQRDLFARAYQLARKEAAAETGLPLVTFPETCPYALEQALDDDFWPE